MRTGCSASLSEQAFDGLFQLSIGLGAVLTEVLTNRQLHEQLPQAAQPALPSKEPRGKSSLLNRLWQTTIEHVRRTVQTVQRFGRGVGMALVAAGGVLAGIVYAARKQIASVASTVYRGGRRLLGRALTTLARMMPSFVFGGT